jgi:uncharacterized protein (TIGR02145 family)
MNSRNILLATAATLPLLYGCGLFGSDDDEAGRFKATLESNTFSANVAWGASDVIKINGTSSTAITRSGDNNSTAAVTVPDVLADYYAFYPGSTARSFNSDTYVYNASISNIQSWGGNDALASGVCPAIARSNTGGNAVTLSFQNLCGIVRADITGTWTGVRKVRLQLAPTDTKGVAGTFYVTTGELTNNKLTFDATADGGNNNGTVDGTESGFTSLGAGTYIDVDFGSNTLKNLNNYSSTSPLTVYFVIPPGNYDAGLDISLWDNNGHQLMKGYSATQTVKVERNKVTNLGQLNFSLVFAGSNIYWDTDHLTFADESSTAFQYYQGVFFKWGSLVGMAADGTWSDSSTPLYVPSSSTPTTSTTWSIGYATSNPWGGNDFDDIPYNRSAFAAYGRGYTHLGTTFDGYTGDICQFLTATGHAPAGRWRMPVSAEFGYATTSYSAFDASTPNTPDVAGQGSIHAGRTYINANVVPQPFFPASGYRNISGELISVGNSGSYWSSATQNSSNAYALNYTNDSVNPANYTFRSAYGFPVRCVRE